MVSQILNSLYIIVTQVSRTRSSRQLSIHIMLKAEAISWILIYLLPRLKLRICVILRCTNRTDFTGIGNPLKSNLTCNQPTKFLLLCYTKDIAQRWNLLPSFRNLWLNCNSVGGFGRQTPPTEKDKFKMTHISIHKKIICYLRAKEGRWQDTKY